ncbi:MAG: bifunctional folylpolyglutamate synthase/dihydrofolate synthase [Microbacteriaceae bacterium]
MNDFRAEADAIFASLLARIGEANPQPRLNATQMAVDYLGNPERMYRVITLTGTNGKTSTARMIESLLRAHGIRVGLLTSPHLERVNERILIDGEPISDEKFVENWRDIEYYLEMVDTDLSERGEEPLTYFEALTVLAFAAFADAPVDVAVLEVGMGGTWDSTNVADADVAVFTPIDLDHVDRLGKTIAEIAKTEAGIIKAESIVVTSAQHPDAMEQIAAAAEKFGSTPIVEGDGFELLGSVKAVGGQVVLVRGRAGTYDDVPVTLHGIHQAHNAALAIAAVESFLGDGTRPIATESLAEGLGTVTSPGRLQYLSATPPIIVDAAHNPHGARALATALADSLPFERYWCVLGVLGDKDYSGIISALDPYVDGFIVTQSQSDRAIDADALAKSVTAVAGPDRVHTAESLTVAITVARGLCASGDAIIVTGSITLVGECIALAKQESWK